MSPFNVIYGRHHDVVKRTWTLKSDLSLNTSCVSLGKLSNLQEPVPSSVNTGLNLSFAGCCDSKNTHNEHTTHICLHDVLPIPSSISRNPKWDYFLVILPILECFQLGILDFILGYLKIRHFWQAIFLEFKFLHSLANLI